MAVEEFTWDDPVGSYVGTWQRIVLDPRGFFARESSTHDLQGPIGFLLVTLGIGGLGLVLGGWGLGALPRLLVGGLVRTCLAAVLAWLVASRVFGGRGELEATLRGLCHAAALTVFIGVPGLRVLAELYGLFLALAAIEGAQRLDAGRAALTILATALAAAILHRALGLGTLFHAVHPAWLVGAWG